MNIGGALKEVRETLVRKKQGQVSEETGISQTQLSLVENGYRDAGRDLIVKLCAYYDIPEVVLMWMATEKTDIKPEKQALYDALTPVMTSLIEQYFEAK